MYSQIIAIKAESNCQAKSMKISGWPTTASRKNIANGMETVMFHDATRTTRSLEIGCLINAKGTMRSDLTVIPY